MAVARCLASGGLLVSYNDDDDDDDDDDDEYVYTVTRCPRSCLRRAFGFI